MMRVGKGQEEVAVLMMLMMRRRKERERESGTSKILKDWVQLKKLKIVDQLFFSYSN